MDKYLFKLEDGELFKEELFIIPNERDMKWLGTADSALCNLFNSNDLLEAQEAFLDSVFKQIPVDPNLSLKDTCYSLSFNRPVSFMQISNEVESKVIFAWGCADQIRGIQSSLFQPVQLGNKWFLSLPSIEDTITEKPHKAALWKAMKHIYNI